MINRPRRTTATVVAAVCLILLAACGSSSGGEDSATAGNETSAQPSGAAGSPNLPDSPAAAAAAAYTGVLGTPTTVAVKPAESVFVWIVSCGQSVPTCSEPSAALADAAKAAGWTAKVCDGQLNPQGWANCIRQGISAKASGIAVVGQDCNSFQSALAEAQAASIPTIAVGGNDCDVTGGTKMFSAVVQNLPGLTAQQWWERMGELQAAWMIAKSNGKAQVLSLKFTDAIWGGWMQHGVANGIAACSGCKIVSTLEVTNQDISSQSLPQKFSTALLKNPTVNAVNVPIDGMFFAGLSQAVQSSGRSDQLSVIGAFGQPGNLDMIRNGNGQDATVAFSAAWVSWAGIDALARVLAKEPVQAGGIGVQVIDREHNMPAPGAQFSYNPPVDYPAAYKKAWGRG